MKYDIKDEVDSHSYLVNTVLLIGQGTASDLVVQVVLIAESMRLQAMMATYGIQTQVNTRPTQSDSC